MKKSIKSILVLVALTFGLQAQAGIQNYSFSGILTSGDYINETFSGDFSFDDATIDNSGFDIATLLSFNMNFLNTNYTLVNAIDYPTIMPDVSFQDGSFLGLSISLDYAPPLQSVTLYGFTFIPGQVNQSEAFVAYDTDSIGFSGDGSVTYTMTAPIPEPETYAMLLAGLGLVGLIGAKRKVA